MAMPSQLTDNYSIDIFDEMMLLSEIFIVFFHDALLNTSNCSI